MSAVWNFSLQVTHGSDASERPGELWFFCSVRCVSGLQQAPSVGESLVSTRKGLLAHTASISVDQRSELLREATGSPLLSADQSALNQLALNPLGVNPEFRFRLCVAKYGGTLRSRVFDSLDFERRGDSVLQPLAKLLMQPFSDRGDSRFQEILDYLDTLVV